MVKITIGQDLHLTYYPANSPFFNPAKSGDFWGLVKVGGSYRSQYERTFEQGLFHADVNFTSSFHKNHWWSTGMQLVYDVAGSLKSGQTGGGFQCAYHLPLDEEFRHVISGGIQTAVYHYSYNTSAYSSETTINGLFDPDLATLSQFNANLITIGVGAGYKSTIGSSTDFTVGVAVMESNRGEIQIIKDKTRKDYRYNLNMGFRTQLGPYFSISPAVYHSRSGLFSNTNLQLMTELKLNNDYRWSILAGSNHRMGESVSVLVGYKSRRMMTCLAIDILNGAPKGTIANPGAIELSGYYIFYKYKKPVIHPILLCPGL